MEIGGRQDAPRLRAYVDLPARLDHRQWQARHDADEVPDATPYGLHRLAEHGVDVTFRQPQNGRVLERILRAADHRTGGYELAEAVVDSRARHRARADVVLGYDERTSVPAALLAAVHASPPVVAGVGWLTTREAARPLHARLAAAALPRAAAVWAQCAPMLPLLRDEWGVPAQRVHFVPFGIDTDFYVEQPWPADGGLVVSAGEDRFRDHAMLVEAVARVRRRLPHARLELATGLPVDMPDGLGTIHRGRLDGRMRELYRRGSVVAVALAPSLTGSGLTVILEAMASGRPIVVTGNPGLEDYVEDGVTGVLVRPDDPDAFAAALYDLLADADRAAEIGREAARRVRQAFTTDVMAEHLAGLVRAVG